MTHIYLQLPTDPYKLGLLHGMLISLGVTLGLSLLTWLVTPKHRVVKLQVMDELNPTDELEEVWRKLG